MCPASPGKAACVQSFSSKEIIIPDYSLALALFLTLVSFCSSLDVYPAFFAVLCTPLR